MTSVETPPAVRLAEGTWKVDAAHSTIGFVVRDFVVAGATIHGHFTDFEGVVDVHGEDARASGVIRTASVATHEDTRDEHLRSENFLAADRYPEIRFESTRIEPAGEGKLAIEGRLTIQENALPIELEADVRGPLTDQWGNERLALEARARIEWGEASFDLIADVSAIRA
jgi:polyisoprenoid-binding protein YceI